MIDTFYYVYHRTGEDFRLCPTVYHGRAADLAMIAIACVLLYLAIAKQYEPLLLLPIAFGMLLVNLPLGGVMDPPTTVIRPLTTEIQDSAQYAVIELQDAAGNLLNGFYQDKNASVSGGLLLLPLPRGQAGHLSAFDLLGHRHHDRLRSPDRQPQILPAGRCGTAGYLHYLYWRNSPWFYWGRSGFHRHYRRRRRSYRHLYHRMLAPHLLGPIAVAAYSYMALVPVIQPPIMKLLTTKKERSVVMKQLRPVFQGGTDLLPGGRYLNRTLMVPSATPLIGMLMLGNLMRESGVVDRLVKTAQNELMNIITIFLGVTVGATATAENFLNLQTLGILALGLCAFAIGTAGGVLFGKLMYLFSGGKINPLIGSAGVSAVPMAARVSQKVGAETNPTNFLLMHAMGPNVAGVIGSAVAAVC